MGILPHLKDAQPIPHCQVAVEIELQLQLKYSQSWKWEHSWGHLVRETGVEFSTLFGHIFLCASNFFSFLVPKLCHWPIRSTVKVSDWLISLKMQVSRSRRSESSASAVRAGWAWEAPAKIPHSQLRYHSSLWRPRARTRGDPEELLESGPQLTWAHLGTVTTKTS